MNKKWKCLTSNSTNTSDDHCYHSTWGSALSDWEPSHRRGAGRDRGHFCTCRLPSLCCGPGLIPSFLPGITLISVAPFYSSNIRIFLSSNDQTNYHCEQPCTLRFGQKINFPKFSDLPHPHPTSSPHPAQVLMQAHTCFFTPSCFLLVANKRIRILLKNLAFLQLIPYSLHLPPPQWQGTRRSLEQGTQRLRRHLPCLQGCRRIESRVFQKVPNATGRVGKGLEMMLEWLMKKRLARGVSLLQMRREDQKFKELSQDHNQSLERPRRTVWTYLYESAVWKTNE